MDDDRVRSKALDLLARREHSAHELQNKLVNKGFDAEVVKKVVQQLAEAGMQSDSRFAENYSHARESRGFGPIRILLELQERGVEATLARRCVDKRDYQWSVLAQKQLQKKYGRQSADDMKELSSMQRFLHYRGFDSHLVKLASDYDV